MTNGTPMGAAAEASCQYREAAVAAVTAGERNLAVLQRGHGTAAIVAQAAMKCGSGRALLVCPKPQFDTWIRQLAEFGVRCVPALPKRDAGLELCRNAMLDTGGFAVYLASPAHLAGIGHWLEAWPDSHPFGFVAVLDAWSYRNMSSEKGRGLDAVVRRADTALLAVFDDQPVPDALPPEWNVRACMPGGPVQGEGA